ncbi:MAG TPA: ABC transporter substrate-binding protein [Stellaceae bacterium]|nr:ABC transporter substrate-binding protein [Stellaceae bacterium]
MHRRSFLKASAAAALLPMAASTTATAAQKQQVLRLAMTLSDIPLTTGQATGGAEGIRFIGNSLYDGLFQWELRHRDRTSKLIPSLAESYTIDPETKTTWTFRLRKGVKFHDGSEFTADAVIWNIDKLLNRKAPQFDPAQNAAGGFFIADLKSYRKVDDYTVALTTAKPDSMFFYRISYIMMSSPDRWKALGGDWRKFAQHPSGTGPWILDSLVPHQRAELVRNPHYWDPSRVPKLDRLILFPMPDATTRASALLAGQVDWIEAPPPDTVPRLRAAGKQIITNVYPHIWPYFISYTKDSPFSDIRVRKAANLGIDRDGLVQFLGGLAKPAVGSVDVSSPWFGKPTFEIKHDPAQAKALLAAAGYGPNKPCKVKFLTSQAGSGQMQPVPMNEFVQESLKDVGFDVSIEVIDWEALRARRGDRADGPENKGIYGLNNSWSTQDPDFGLLSVISSKRFPPAGNNWGLYSDPAADAIITRVVNEFDPDKRDGILAELHQHVVDQSMWIWVVHDLNPRGLAPDVKGFVPPRNWFVDLTTVYIA